MIQCVGGLCSIKPQLSPATLLQIAFIGALLFALWQVVIRYQQIGTSSGNGTKPTGLDAVEKGDSTTTKSSSAEHVPYDLEKRAIFLKVPLYMLVFVGYEHRANQVIEMDDGRS